MYSFFAQHLALTHYNKTTCSECNPNLTPSPPLTPNPSPSPPLTPNPSPSPPLTPNPSPSPPLTPNPSPSPPLTPATPTSSSRCNQTTITPTATVTQGHHNYTCAVMGAGT
ncbi:hypothetical protein Pmani_015194 [Petrolisthes manimaculis]|uniref:Uncharacterized protein n=1 Tax=Petrolisthes manimaculis TaxID=1843537 RepID=A0AAE1PTZ5_9EUCA|nr:hypothetical protein Pmani_015194 [Petrolisthes manimaculis]